MKNIYKSIAEFQQDVPIIHQGATGYGYTYADLGAIFTVILPILKDKGLGFTQLLDGEDLKTVIFHIETGESIESTVHIKQDVTLAKMNAFQVMGSAITYYRRYALTAALGLITEKDIDAATETPKPAPKSQPKKPALTNEQFESAQKGTKAQIKKVLEMYAVTTIQEKGLQIALTTAK